MNTIRQTNKKLLVINLLLMFVIVAMVLDLVPSAWAGGGTSSGQQFHYNFRLDSEGLNTEANGWLAADDNPSSDLVKGTTYRVRFTASQEGTKDLKNVTPTLEYSQTSCTADLVDVPDTATTEHFEYTTSSYYTDGDATTTNLFAASEPTWQNGVGQTTDGSNFNLPVDVYTEYEFAFTPTTNATNGGTYYMRMSNDLNSYPACAQFTMETPAAITVSGNVYSDEVPTFYDCNADPLTIKVSVDGGAATTGNCTVANGTYSIDVSQPAGAGSEVAVYIDSGESPNATTVTLAADSGSNISGLHLYQNRVAVTYEAGSLITNGDLFTADNGDTGIRYAVTGTDLLTDSGMELHVWTGKTYDPGGQVDTTSGDLHLDDNATAYIDTVGSVIDGDVIVDGGSTGTTLQFQANTTVAGGAITTLDDGGTNAVVNYSGTPTVTITGTGNIGGGTSPSITFYGLTIGTATAATTTLVSSATVAGLLDVDTGDSLSISASQTLSNTGSSNAVIDGDITGASGRLRFTSASGGPGAGAGTLSAITRFDASGGNIASTTFDARTYSNDVEIFSDNSAGAARSVAMANATYTLSGGTSHLYVINDSATYTLTLDGALNPTVSVDGDLDFTGSGASSEIITSGTGTWTVSGNVTFTDGTYTATAGNTLTMNGTGTLTSNAQTLQNLTLSGSSITLANATHTIAGNLNMSGTVSAGMSTITMTGTSNSIAGGGNTLNILTIDPSSAGTITLQTSNLTVGSTLTVAAGDELAIDTVSLTHTDSSDVAGTGDITGSGTLIFTNASGGPGTTITTLSSAVRFDASGGNVASTTFDARTYSGRVEAYADNTAGAARSVAMANATYTISGATSHLYVINDNDTYTLTLDGALNPTVNIEGDLDFTGTGGSDEEITTGTGVWTVSGNINLTDGNITFTSGNTFQMNGTSKTITSAGEIFQNLSITGTGDVSNLDLLTVAADFGIGASATFEHGTDVDFIAQGDGITAFVIENGGTFDSATAGTGKLILDGVDNDQWFDGRIWVMCKLARVRV